MKSHNLLRTLDTIVGILETSLTNLLKPEACSSAAFSRQYGQRRLALEDVHQRLRSNTLPTELFGASCHSKIEASTSTANSAYAHLPLQLLGGHSRSTGGADCGTGRGICDTVRPPQKKDLGKSGRSVGQGTLGHHLARQFTVKCATWARNTDEDDAPKTLPKNTLTSGLPAARAASERARGPHSRRGVRQSKRLLVQRAPLGLAGGCTARARRWPLLTKPLPPQRRLLSTTRRPRGNRYCSTPTRHPSRRYRAPETLVATLLCV